MTTSEAKRIIKNELDKRGIQCDKITAKSISFQDLARADCVFVTVKGYPFDGENGVHTSFWHDELAPLAAKHGFRITT